MKNQIIKQSYSCKGTALAAANYLREFGFDAEPKFLNGAWKVVTHETEGDYWHRDIKPVEKTIEERAEQTLEENRRNLAGY